MEIDQKFSSALDENSVMASPIYTSATAQVSKEFHVSTTVAILGLSTQTIGFALGPVLGAPLSETLGRLWVYRLTFPLFLIFTMATALSKNIGRGYSTTLVVSFIRVVKSTN